MAQTIAICNQKGGVSKTTTCLTLGACLVEAGYPTLLVDLDPQANLTVASGADDDNDQPSISDLINARRSGYPVSFDEAVHLTSYPGLDILTADTSLAIIEHELYGVPDYEIILRGILNQYGERYAYIFIDCSPSLGSLTIMALTAANRVIVPVQCDYLSAWGVMRLIDTITAVHDHTNPKLVYSLLVSMYDQRNNVSKQVLNRLEESFKDHLFSTIIGLDTRIRESVINGEPVIVYSPKTRASIQYRALAHELLELSPSGA